MAALVEEGVVVQSRVLEIHALRESQHVVHIKEVKPVPIQMEHVLNKETNAEQDIVM